MSTVRMKRLTAIVNSQDADGVTKELLQQSVLHFVKVKELHRELEGKIETALPSISPEKAGDFRRRTESLLSMIAYNPALSDDLRLETYTPLDMEKTSLVLQNITVDLDGVRDKQKALEQEIHKLEDIERQTPTLESLKGGMGLPQKSVFLSIKTGTVPSSQMEKFALLLKEIPSVHLVIKSAGDKTTLLLVTMMRDRERVNAIREQCGFSEITIPLEMEEVKGDIKGKIGEKIGALKKEQQKLAEEAVRKIEGNRDKLESLWRNLKIQELYGRVESFYSKTSKTTLFSGWVPARLKTSVEEGIRKASEGKCYIEWADPKESDRDKIPVKFSNPKFLKPFQKLVTGYAVPEYGTIDPTPVVALAYLIMFGLMFGDVGHGFVIFLVGLVGVLLNRKKRKAFSSGNLAGDQGETKGIAGLFPLVMYCGVSAMIAGVLFGAYFGIGLLKPLWFDYHGVIAGSHAPSHGFVKDIYGVLLITIYFGIAIIGIGLLLNWINCISRKEWFKLFLHKSGILGGFIYGAGVYAAYFFISHDYRQLPPSRFIVPFLLVPAVLFMLKPPLEFIIERRHGHGKHFSPMTIVDFIMEWIVEMLEIFSGYLANTLSFMRVAGLGIAHVSLMIAFFQIAEMASAGGRYTIFSYVILVLGNVLVIGLEGLSAGIQSLRLNYYEFFSRYFSGKGALYSPISLKSAKQGTP